MKKFLVFVGARPNLMKAYPLCKEMDKRGVPYDLYNSGQHYDYNLSNIFHEQFNMDKIIHMGCKHNGNSIKNIQEITSKAVDILKDNFNQIAGVIVFGDVATTLAVSLACTNLGVYLIHIESGLRSYDISMPEELIRISVDHMSDVLFVPSEVDMQNIDKENCVGEAYMVGNIMIDCLIDCLERSEKADLGLDLSKPYLVVTLHRPENVDNIIHFMDIFNEISILSRYYDIVFPIHPRTRSVLEKEGMISRVVAHNIHVRNPMGYLEFIKLVKNSKGVITDSGGIQEETTYLNIPCFTLRKNTERPITIMQGTNHLVSIDNLIDHVTRFADSKKDCNIKFWDGKTSERIVDVLIDYLK